MSSVERKVEDLGEEKEGVVIETREISAKDKLQFAKWVLRGAFVFFLMSIGIWMYQQSCGEILLEICRTGVLPIVSFVIIDYFGSRRR